MFLSTVLNELLHISISVHDIPDVVELLSVRDCSKTLSAYIYIFKANLNESLHFFNRS